MNWIFSKHLRQKRLFNKLCNLNHYQLFFYPFYDERTSQITYGLVLIDQKTTQFIKINTEIIKNEINQNLSLMNNDEKWAWFEQNEIVPLVKLTNDDQKIDVLYLDEKKLIYHPCLNDLDLKNWSLLKGDFDTLSATGMLDLKLESSYLKLKQWFYNHVFLINHYFKKQLHCDILKKDIIN